MKRTAFSVWTVAIVWTFLSASGGVLMAQTYLLASAQVITSTDRAPVLKLTANGPIAFSIQPPSSDAVATPNTLTVRLYGVLPGDVATAGALDPFVVVASAMEGGSQVTITVNTIVEGQRLTARTGTSVNVLEIVAVAQP